MASQWFYRQDDVEYGPCSSDHLKALVASGQVQRDNLVWKEGMQDWVTAETLAFLYPPSARSPRPPVRSSPPPVRSSPPQIRSSPPMQQPEADDALAALSNASASPSSYHKPLPKRISNQSNGPLWAYRGLLLVSIIAVMLPWVSSSSSVSVNLGDMGQDMNRSGLSGFGGQQMQQIGNQNASVAASPNGSLVISGLFRKWGIPALSDLGVLLWAPLGGIVLSFLGPNKLLADKDKLAMASIGGLIVLLAVIVLLNVSGSGNTDVNMQSQYASASAQTSIGIGLYLCLLAGLAASILGFRIDYRSPTA